MMEVWVTSAYGDCWVITWGEVMLTDIAFVQVAFSGQGNVPSVLHWGDPGLHECVINNYGGKFVYPY
jgi:hypothetical protein